MKFAAALVALALAVTAPLAVQGVCTQANQDLVDNMVLTSRMKSSTVTGKGRVTQIITVTNNNPTAVSGLVLTTTSTRDLPYWVSPPYKRGKHAQAKGTKPVLSENLASYGARSSIFTLPAGKTFRATVTYKANTCPQLAQPTAVLAQLFISTDPNGATACSISATPQPVTVNKYKTCP